jgi:excinuclease UvrABC nuclease subunit
MRDRAKNLDFEEAQSIKETLVSLSTLSEKQKVRDIIDGDIDVFIKYEKYDNIYMALTQIRSSQIIGIKRYEVSL